VFLDLAAPTRARPQMAGPKPTPTATGAWRLPPNATADRYYFDPSFAQSVVDLAHRKGFRRVLDVGAGIGRYVRFYRERGLEAFGIDGLDGAHERSGGLVQEVDVAREPNWCDVFDVVTCMEVLEHVPRQYESHVLEQLVCAAAHRLVLSWAGPSQKGNGHVNLRDASYVRGALAQRGWREVEAETRQLKNDSRLPWYRGNVLSFERMG